MRRQMPKIVALALASTTLVPVAQAAEQNRYWFRINGGGGSISGTPGVPSVPSTPTVPATPQDPSGPPPATPSSEPTWGYCGAATTATYYADDCDNDGTPNMDVDDEGIPTDNDPDDGWTPTLTDDDVRPVNRLVFDPVKDVEPGSRVMSNVARYNGSKIYVGQITPFTRMVSCATPEECPTSVDDPIWDDARDAEVGGDKPYIRLRYVVQPDDKTVQVTINDTSFRGPRYYWTVKTAPAVTETDTDGDGSPDEIDPTPDVPSPLQAALYWRYKFTDLMPMGYNRNDPESMAGAKIGEFEMCFEYVGCVADDPSSFEVSASVQANREALVDGSTTSGTWRPDGPDGYIVIRSKAWGITPMNYKLSFNMPDYNGWREYNIGPSELQYSDDGTTWTTYEKRSSVGMGYSGVVGFTVNRTKPTSP